MNALTYINVGVIGHLIIGQSVQASLTESKLL